MFRFVSADYPESPGVYLMKDASGRILYVGKAISLRKRLSSYFRAKADLSPKTAALVAKVTRVDVLLVGTEKEALLLEESLIKKHRPRYNIVLRDDKGSLFFRLDRRSEYPRLTVARFQQQASLRDGSTRFGPFSSASAARSTFKLVHEIFPLRRCTDRAMKNRVRPCLYHQLGQCLGPCCLPVDPARYRAMVAQVEQFLSGRSRALVRDLTRRMREASGNLRYEEAAQLRDRIRAIEKTLEGQASVLRDELDRDVLAVASAGDGLGLGLLFVRGGRLLDQKTFHFAGLAGGDILETLETFLPQFYGAGRYIPGRIALSHAISGAELAEVLSERRDGPVKLGPARGPDERRLMELAANLALTAHSRDAKQDAAGQLERALNLAGPPRRIEGVDISHLAGGAVRAGLVVFEDGAEARDQWRAYALPAVEGAGDDYAALAQWAARRVESGPPWPDLLLVDGGRGQLAAVLRALEQAGADAAFPCVSIAKGPSRRAGELEDRVFLPGRRNPAALKPGSPGLLFLQRVRDAAHRFAIGKSRRAGRKARLDSELMSVSGVGPALARRLWDAFGSMDAMRAAGAEGLARIKGVGPALAERMARALAGEGEGGV